MIVKAYLHTYVERAATTSAVDALQTMDRSPS
ncbi:hypothetical protein GGE45_005904 [Rhizobium aethiopicum]|nr:hypothetical protein [Rhizobium aethiopicum]